MPSRLLVGGLALCAVIATALVWWSLEDTAPGRPVAPGEAHDTPRPEEPRSAAVAVPGALPPEAPGEAAVPAPAAAAAAAAPRGRTAVERVQPWSAPLEIVFRDAHTGQALPFIRADVRVPGASARRRASAGRNGRARTGVAFEVAELRLQARDLLSNSSLGRAEVEHRPARGGGGPPPFEWSLELGPTLGLRLDLSQIPEEAELSGRIREVNRTGEVHTWSWRPLKSAPRGLDPEQLLWLRYGEREKDPEERYVPHVQVWAEGTPYFAEAPIPSTAGVHAPIDLVLRAVVGSLRGRVADTKGRPVDGAQVLVPGGRPAGSGFAETDGNFLETRTGQDGTYDFAGVAPGAHLTLVVPAAGPVERAEVRVAAGRETVQDFVVEIAEPAGDIRGALVAPQGSDEPLAIVVLSSDTGVILNSMLAGFNLFSDPDGEGLSAYAFEDLPQATYMVSLVPLDGRRYDPVAVTMDIPATGVDFVTEESLEDRPVRLIVSDAETGAPVRDAAAMMGIHPFWFADIESIDEGLYDGPRLPDFHLVIGAPGYVPVYLNREDFTEVAGGLELRAALHPGHGFGLVILDFESAARGSSESFGEAFPAVRVPGARVIVEGETAIITQAGPNGLIVAVTEFPVESYRVVAPGYVTVMKHRFHDHERTPDGLGFVLMARE